MTAMLLVDQSEPRELIRLLEQSVPVTVLNLNQTSRSDYYFGGEDEQSRQFGRVQAGELLGNIDSMEDELRRYYKNADENNQIIEGLISPIPLTRKNKNIEYLSVRRTGGLLYSYKVAPSGFIFDEHAWNVSSSVFFAWIRGLKRVGIDTYYTVNYIDTAKLLASIYHNEQKAPDSHRTLDRIYVPTVSIKEQSRQRITIKEQDNFVRALMFLSHAYSIGIGEEKAKSIATRYKTIYDLNMASVQEVCQCPGIGKIIATKLLIALGRDDV